uniref:Uncharacterized protein n=1 Tax=Poecilia reticulata TaxID=8081 RepID=A0A3P9PW41_POERE
NHSLTSPACQKLPTPPRHPYMRHALDGSGGSVGQPGSLPLEKEPSCLVLASLSCCSCRWPRRYRYSMCITSVFLMRAFSRNSSRILGRKPGLSFPARRKWRYRARTCFCSLFRATAASISIIGD